MEENGIQEIIDQGPVVSSPYDGILSDTIEYGEESVWDIIVSYLRMYLGRVLGIVLVVGLILGPYIIYRKHKGEKGLWRKIVVWEIGFFIMITALDFLRGLLLYEPIMVN